MDTLIDDLLTPSDLRLRDDLGYDYTLSNIPVYNDKLFFLMNQSRDETELGKTRATNQQFNDLDKKIDIELNNKYMAKLNARRIQALPFANIDGAFSNGMGTRNRVNIFNRGMN